VGALGGRGCGSRYVPPLMESEWARGAGGTATSVTTAGHRRVTAREHASSRMTEANPPSARRAQRASRASTDRVGAIQCAMRNSAARVRAERVCQTQVGRATQPRTLGRAA
jgi:hypothetical protein